MVLDLFVALHNCDIISYYLLKLKFKQNCQIKTNKSFIAKIGRHLYSPLVLLIQRTHIIVLKILKVYIDIYF